MLGVQTAIGTATNDGAMQIGDGAERSQRLGRSEDVRAQWERGRQDQRDLKTGMSILWVVPVRREWGGSRMEQVRTTPQQSRGCVPRQNIRELFNRLSGFSQKLNHS